MDRGLAATATASVTLSTQHGLQARRETWAGLCSHVAGLRAAPVLPVDATGPPACDGGR